MKRAVEWPLKSFEVSFVYCLNFGFCWKTQQATEGGRRKTARAVMYERARAGATSVIRGSQRNVNFSLVCEAVVSRSMSRTISIT